MEQPGTQRRTTAIASTLLCFLAFLVAIAGCHSPYISATVENRTGAPVSPLEVDYPSASFGTELLAAGGTYKYRFKILGSGGTKVSWTDGQHRERTVPGPNLHEGQEGSLRIELTSAGATWSSNLQP